MRSGAGRIIVYVVMILVVWSVVLVTKLAGLTPFTWWWWAFTQFMAQTCMAIVASTVAILSGIGSRDLWDRIRLSLLTALALSFSFGLLAWLIWFLPFTIRVSLGAVGLLANLVVTFSAAIAAAGKNPPLRAIVRSARFVSSTSGIKLILLLIVIGGVPGVLYAILAKFSGWQPVLIQNLSTLVQVTSVTAGSLVAGIVVWNRFGKPGAG